MRCRGICFVSLLGRLCGWTVALANLESKKGLALGGKLDDSDIKLLTSEKSPISWYYNWSPTPSNIIGNSTIFIPLIHSLETLKENNIWSALDGLPSSSEYMLTFNEPDEAEENGGSYISPEDAAKAYIEDIVPHRNSSRSWQISHPVVTGSERGLNWLRDFNESCYDIDPRNGCPADFIAMHWFGDFAGLASWLRTLRGFYNSSELRNTSILITEMALPQGSEDDNISMLEQTMSYLDGLDYIAGYAWFGVFRKKNANEWTGDGVSLLENDGDLTGLGEKYLGGATSDFKTEGDSDSGSCVLQVRRSTVVLSLALALCVLNM
uniref:Asl1-like glycosyl hydrolase catalytic domain-containing protein n=1 Tax=Bionectria ochroleuca TaxID=29856 RepID=A0A8H7MYP3_BIOOC